MPLTCPAVGQTTANFVNFAELVQPEAKLQGVSLKYLGFFMLKFDFCETNILQLQAL